MSFELVKTLIKRSLGKDPTEATGSQKKNEKNK